MPKKADLKRDPKEEKIRKVVFTTVGIIAAAFILNFFTGIFNYTYGFIRCGRQPIAASRFMAGYDYYTPGQQGYGVNPFMEYYCSTDEAENAGFHPAN
jgi:hypothetical protein